MPKLTNLPIPKDPSPGIQVEGLHLQHTSLNLANQKKLEYEKIHGEYDLTIRTRGDIKLNHPLNCFAAHDLIKKNPNLVIVPDNHRVGAGVPICDALAIGSTETMNIYCNLISYIDQYNNESCHFHYESLLSYHLLNQGLIFPPVGVFMDGPRFWRLPDGTVDGDIDAYFGHWAVL